MGHGGLSDPQKVITWFMESDWWLRQKIYSIESLIPLGSFSCRRTTRRAGRAGWGCCPGGRWWRRRPSWRWRAPCCSWWTRARNSPSSKSRLFQSQKRCSCTCAGNVHVQDGNLETWKQRVTLSLEKGFRTPVWLWLRVDEASRSEEEKEDKTATGHHIHYSRVVSSTSSLLSPL